MSKKMRKVKRIQINVSEDFFDALREIADFENKSISKLGGELFEKLEPGILQARDFMRVAKSMTDEARKSLFFDEIVRHGKQLEDNVNYGLENIEKVLKDSE